MDDYNNIIHALYIERLIGCFGETHSKFVTGNKLWVGVFRYNQIVSGTTKHFGNRNMNSVNGLILMYLSIDIKIYLMIHLIPTVYLHLQWKGM